MAADAFGQESHLSKYYFDMKKTFSFLIITICSVTLSVASNTSYFRNNDFSTISALDSTVSTTLDPILRSKIESFLLSPKALKVKNNNLVLVATNKTFREFGIDMKYKSFISQSLEETNKGIEKMITDGIIKKGTLNKMLKKARKERSAKSIIPLAP